MSRFPAAYARDAADYDRRTSVFGRYREMVVDALPLRPGDTVIDAGCGTGLCFAALHERIGPDGVIIGVDAAPDMLELAAERVAAAGWSNVALTCAPLETAELPMADHALFCAVHDVLQSPHAIDNVLGHLRPGAAVTAGGGKWGPAWAIGLNASVLTLHAPYVRDFAGFERPWSHLGERVPDLAVRELALGAGYVATGRLTQPPRR
jgi:SAM-dependent methyltransferase